MRGLGWLLLAALLALPASGAGADDWTAVRLRGVVLEFVDGDWQQLERGALVPDDRLVRTVSGRVTLVRGAETIELGPDTQIRIFDKEGRRPFTTVRQDFGTVAVEAEKRNVQHFAMQTPYLVAVVKGTEFVVSSDQDSSKVRVGRGAVEVRDRARDTMATVRAGQSASIDDGGPLNVAGWGKLPEILPGPAARNLHNQKDGKSNKEEKDRSPDKSKNHTEHEHKSGEKDHTEHKETSGKGKGVRVRVKKPSIRCDGGLGPPRVKLDLSCRLLLAQGNLTGP